MSNVVIVDTGLCNLDSVARAFEECGAAALVTSDARDLRGATQIVLPGVGTFPEAMTRLTANGLADEMTEQVLGRGIPFLGVCLGMQLMASSGGEIRSTLGLGWIAGTVGLMQPDTGERIPHIGWNEVHGTEHASLFRNVEPGTDFYFVHSYAMQVEVAHDIAASTPYGGGLTSAVERGSMFGVQFHPEKSQTSGFQVIRNFLSV